MPEQSDFADRLAFFARAVQAGFSGRVLYKLDDHLAAASGTASFEIPGEEYWHLRQTPRHEYPAGLDRLRVNSRRPLSWYHEWAPDSFLATWPEDREEYRIFPDGSTDETDPYLAVRFDDVYEETHRLPTEFEVIEVHVPTEAAVEPPSELVFSREHTPRSDTETSAEP